MRNVKFFKEQIIKYNGKNSKGFRGADWFLERSYAVTMFKNLFDNFQYEKLEENEPLFYAGDRGEKFYIILQGELCVCLPREEK